MTKQAAEGRAGGVGAISLQLRMNCTHRRMSGAYMGSIPSFKLMPSNVTNAQTQSTFITLTPTVETRAGHGETAAFLLKSFGPSKQPFKPNIAHFHVQGHFCTKQKTSASFAIQFCTWQCVVHGSFFFLKNQINLLDFSIVADFHRNESNV